MLGWHVSLHRQDPTSDVPATSAAAHGTRVAVWQTGVWGLKWLDELIQQGAVLDLGGNGYPTRFTAPASVILPRVLGGPPDANEVWGRDEWDVVDERWVGRTAIDHSVADMCADDEWLLIEVWDES